MIKVLELESSKGFGGQEKRTVRLSNNMPSDKVRTYFAANPDSILAREAKKLNIECFAIKMRATYDVPAILAIARLIKELKIDIVSTHSGKDAWLGGMAAKLAGVKCIRVRHLQTPFKNAISYKYLTDSITAVSMGVKEYIVSKGVNPNKVKVVYTGIDTAHFYKMKSSFRDEYAISDNTFLIGIAAVLRSAKRHKDLIDATAKLAKKYEIKLIIIGDGPQWENLQNKIKEDGVQDLVIMTGHRGDTANIINALDLFALPSNMEALGTALLEAQACGVPVVGSNIGGIPEALENGKTGLLFECENVSDLATKIERFVIDKEFRESAGNYAREFIMEKFSVEKMVADTLRQYEELLA